MSYGGQPQLGAVNPLAVVNTVTGVTGLVSGLLSNDGPDKEKYGERGQFIQSLVSMAQAGDVTAWHALGAYGWPKIPTPVPLPNPYSRPPKYGGKVQTHPAGWSLGGNEWGDAYKPIRETAAQAHRQLAYKFTGGAGPVGGDQPIVIPPPPPIVQQPGIPNILPQVPSGNNLPIYTPGVPSVVPATMDPAYPAGGPAPISQASAFTLSPTMIAAGIGLGLIGLAASRPHRNPPRRRSRARRR